MSSRSTRSSTKRALSSTRVPPSITITSVEPPTKRNKLSTPTANQSPSSHKSSPVSEMSSLILHPKKGSLLTPSPPPSTLLIHACNTEGSWGKGIAKLFKNSYPRAFEIYKRHCRESSGSYLVGTALLIPPQTSSTRNKVVESTGGKKGGGGGGGGSEIEKQHFVGCLFTSRSVGRNRDSEEGILEATGRAVRDLMRAVKEWNDDDDEGRNRGEGKGVGKIGEVRMCRINSGLFGVPWEKTKRVLEGIEAEGFREVEVWHPDEGGGLEGGEEEEGRGAGCGR